MERSYEHVYSCLIANFRKHFRRQAQNVGCSSFDSCLLHISCRFVYPLGKDRQFAQFQSKIFQIFTLPHHFNTGALLNAWVIVIADYASYINHDVTYTVNGQPAALHKTDNSLNVGAISSLLTLALSTQVKMVT
ncbi:hypothetical protein CEUSTIGMA_g11732.t1 [Chlamydomonas eustigma]|uniref:Uncharacterized protein n=1 Tax=Chlamydomonas eustigma TaxID=1157962 RepID=A0A250XNC4_9CHLO|nr:hypothetical protein CEUSTIGMA_g11732.t1 [Chlamydomonas eustigma]|eukprot:GAX84310.1 hypothetical protein CEUSTIGMA_g11732.t1 [Chlamydomonas eustigma]